MHYSSCWNKGFSPIKPVPKSLQLSSVRLHDVGMCTVLEDGSFPPSIAILEYCNFNVRMRRRDECLKANLLQFCLKLDYDESTKP